MHAQARLPSRIPPKVHVRRPSAIRHGSPPAHIIRVRKLAPAERHLLHRVLIEEHEIARLGVLVHGQVLDGRAARIPRPARIDVPVLA